MNSEQRISTIGQACELINGATPKTAESSYWDGPHAWITPAEMGKLGSPYLAETRRTLSDSGLANCSATLLPPNSVILSSRAPIGYLVINRVPMATNQGCKGLVPRAGLDHKYLFYFLLANVELLNELGSGTTFKELSATKLKTVQIPLPPLPEQQRIVAILDEAFAGIASAVESAEKNLQNARDLFASFLHSVFAAAWGKEDLTSLESLAVGITDGDHTPPPKSSEGIPFITIGNIAKDSHTIDFQNTFMVPKSYYEQLKPIKKPKYGDVLYTVTGSYGIPVLISNDREFCFQRHIGLIRPKPELKSEWLYYLLMSPQVMTQADARATGTAQKTVSLSVLRSFQVPIFPIEAQLRDASRLSKWDRETQRLENIYQQKLDALAELKQSILQKAFVGELTAEPDKALAEAGL